MNLNIQVGDKVKILKKSDNGPFREAGRGIAVGLAAGKLNDWIKYWEAEDSEGKPWPIGIYEWICVSAPCIRVVKW
jgi:hypothetical protein